MKKTILTINFCLIVFACMAQNVGIGTNTPEGSAQLDITSNNKGLLLPRMTTTARQAISNPAHGLLVYDSTLKKFHYHNGTAWSFMLNEENESGWKIINNDIYNTPNNRLVRITSPAITNNNTNPYSFSAGSLMIQEPDVLSWGLYEYLTLDYNSIEARASTINGHLNRSLSLNRYGGNVGLGMGTGSATHAKLMVNGTVGASVAMFGADKMGVTISADNPEIGFNYYYNNGTKTMKAGYAAYMGMSPQNGSIYIGNFNGQASTANFSTISGAISRITLLQNGNVGIGTATPTYKLSVNGNIRSKEVVVESGWADYVFNEDYNLLSLNETEKFIKKNKHLPGIPSAKEIQENGLAVGDLQTKMMAKIEELTLYVIELKKEIELLKNK